MYILMLYCNYGGICWSTFVAKIQIVEEYCTSWIVLNLDNDNTVTIHAANEESIVSNWTNQVRIFSSIDNQWMIYAI